MRENIVEFFIKENCKAIVIACNTASAKAVQYLRKQYHHIPFIAIEPAYKMVYDYAYNEPTLVLATKGTIESEKFNLLYHTYDNHKTILLPCVGLADVIEEGKPEKIKQYVKYHLEPYTGKVKNVVLGCTHYPLIKKNIRRVLGNVKFFDGSLGVSKELVRQLELRGITFDNKSFSVEFIDTSSNVSKENRFMELMSSSYE